MSAKGYVTPEAVAGFMGVPFTSEQEALCEVAIEAAENWIDAETGHAWMEDTPVTEVFYNPQTVFLRLKGAPILGVTSITVDSPPGCAPTPVPLFTWQYDVHSLQEGRVWSPLSWHAYKATVVYTVDPSVPPPAEIQMACLALSAHYMQGTPAMFDGVDPGLVQRYVVGGELEVEFRKGLAAGASAIPQQVTAYIDNWRAGYVVI